MSTEDYINHDYSMIKDDQRKRGGCGKPGHVTSTPDPAEGDGATLFCVTCEEEARQVAERIKDHFRDTPPEQIIANAQRITEECGLSCGHVPARPDADLTVCWICGEEIIADLETHLYRPLTVNEKLVKRETTRQLRELFHSVHPSELGRILFERQEHNEPSIRLAESIMGRWIVINGRDESVAWSGSRWVPHRQGLPTGEAQICNFETREEAKTYVNGKFPQDAALDPE